MKKIAMFLLALFVIAGCNKMETLQQEEQDTYNEKLKEAEKLKDNEEYEESKTLLNNIISETEDIEYLDEQHAKATEMLSEVEEALAEADNSTTTTSSNKVFIDYATDEFLGKFNSYYEFIDENSERIVFWSEKSINNFNFIEIGFEDEGSNFSYFQKEILYSIDKLSPEKPLVIKTIISEGIPNRGISYTDESGEERYFYIAWSGFDDSLSLVEFENKIPDEGSAANDSSNSDTSSNDS